VGVQVDQAGNQDVVGQGAGCVASSAAGLAGRQDRLDATLVDGDCVVLEYNIGFDRGNPARFDQQVDWSGVVVMKNGICAVWAAC
jgi:hypothetical protein